MTLLTRRAHLLRDDVVPHDTRIELERILWLDVMNLQRSLPPGLLRGKLIELPVGDDIAFYLVDIVLADQVVVNHLPMGGNVASSSVVEGRMRKDVAAKAVKRQEQLLRLFAEGDVITVSEPSKPERRARAVRILGVPFNKGSLKIKLRYRKVVCRIGELVRDCPKFDDSKPFRPVCLEDEDCGDAPANAVRFSNSLLQRGCAHLQDNGDIVICDLGETKCYLLRHP